MDRSYRISLTRLIEHSLLAAGAGEVQAIEACREARKFGLYGLVVNPVWVSLAAGQLRDTEVRVISVAGFPLGAGRTETKVVEAVRAVIDGAREIDMVPNLGRLVAGELAAVEREITELRRALPTQVVLKVIIEAGLLDPGRQAKATQAVVNGGAEFVKTGTGFSGGVTVEQVSTIAAAARGLVKIKASGGIRTLQQCQQLLEAGAARLGTSASKAIMQELLDEGRG